MKFILVNDNFIINADYILYAEVRETTLVIATTEKGKISFDHTSHDVALKSFNALINSIQGF